MDISHQSMTSEQMVTSQESLTAEQVEEIQQNPLDKPLPPFRPIMLPPQTLAMLQPHYSPVSPVSECSPDTLESLHTVALPRSDAIGERLANLVNSPIHGSKC